MELLNLINLPPVARTLFVPLACRARETARAVQYYGGLELSKKWFQN